MLLASDYRHAAWQKIGSQKKWGTLAIITLIYLVITGAISFVMSYSNQVDLVTLEVVRFIPVLYYAAWLAQLLLSGPLMLGYAYVALSVVRAQETKPALLFQGFRLFVSSFVLYLTNAILISLWSILLVIPGIVKAFSYSMSYYILADHPELSANEARKESMRIMNGNKWRLFCLVFSFIGWVLLCLITFGILSLWVKPYMDTAMVEFYESIKENGKTTQNVNIPPVEPVAGIGNGDSEQN